MLWVVLGLLRLPAKMRPLQRSNRRQTSGGGGYTNHNRAFALRLIIPSDFINTNLFRGQTPTLFVWTCFWCFVLQAGCRGPCPWYHVHGNETHAQRSSVCGTATQRTVTLCSWTQQVSSHSIFWVPIVFDIYIVHIYIYFFFLFPRSGCRFPFQPD